MADKAVREISLDSLGIELQPKQAQLEGAMQATGDGVPTVWGMGGSRGSAKSGGLRRIAVKLALQHKGIVIYVLRRVRQDVIENHVEKIKLEFPDVQDFYKAGPLEYAFPNESRICMKAAEDRRDVERISYGPECTFLFVDQAEQFSEDELTSFRICNRWPAMPKGFPKTCYFFNVGKGIGAGFFRSHFNPKSLSFRPNERPADYAFIQCYAWDNYEWFRGETAYTFDEFYRLSSADRFALFISETTEGRKMNQLPKHRRDAELLGNFDSFSGQYFSDVWRM